MKKIIFLLLSFFSIIFSAQTVAASNSFISIVNPVRGNDFWDLKDQSVETAVLGQIEILNKSNLPATWLLRFDVLNNENIINQLKDRTLDEKGLFLEVTQAWTAQAKIQYRKLDIWHAAGSAFLTGYEREQRGKLIDVAFEKFKNIFGQYPVSVGAWWIDAYSLDYMQKKYDITSALIVADQYSTDNYQIWGQYFGTPYYPGKNNALHPAGNLENKLDVVMMQWATRDPVNGYGNGVTESTFSVQANDYIDYHDLDTKYFSSLIDIYTKQKFNQFAHMVVGLENSYSWRKYADEYKKQIEVLIEKRDSNQLSVITMKDFAGWYKKTFPKLSPEQLIVADDPLGSFRKAVWFMNPYYRAGWFLNSDGSVFREIRQYVDGEEELCFRTRCDNVNFATSATRVLDDVSFSSKWVIDEGKISNSKVERKGDDFLISYKNEAGNVRHIEFLPRDISLDGNIFSIDAAILNAIKTGSTVTKNAAAGGQTLDWSLFSVILKLAEFLLFLLLVTFIPGFVLSRNFLKKDSLFLRLFISGSVGFVVLTLLFYITSLLKIRPLVFAYILISLILYVRFKPPFVILRETKDLIIRFFPSQRRPQNDRVGWFNLILIAIILAGTIFQAMPTFKSGLNFSYGIGLWGPNTHDGVWHIALINQLVKSVPPENPVYSGVTLKNYHFFYDLLVAVTNYLSGLPVSDLVFRFYPVIFSLMLGLGSYYLIMKLFKNRMEEMQVKVAAVFSLYFIYFAGSFGWIVEFLREGHFGGESAFWANQAVSFNLNPPFAVSLVILISLFHILFSNTKGIVPNAVAIIMVGTLASFKSYTGILVLGALCFVAAVRILRNKDFTCFWTVLFSILVTALLFLSNFQASSALIIFVPFWFIHSMVDSPDRVGWVRLSLARTTSQALEQWPKFIIAETLSLLLFIFGNLGLRFLSLGYLLKIKEIFKNDTLLFISTTAILSSVIPILFIQSGNPWNTIQFFYPFLYISALFSGPVIAFLVFRLNKILVFSFVCLVLIIAPINSLVTAGGYLSKTPHAFISSKELAGLQFLASEPKGTVLTYPYDGKLKTKVAEPWPILVYDSTAYVSAFSKKAGYLEDEPQNQILLTDYKKRLVASKDFFLKPVSEGSKFLRDNNIKYIYIPKIYDIRLDEGAQEVKNIFENEEIIIYQVNQ
ncbi:MAG: hypothetical protein PHE48_01770 [Candidatus Daviesbacteria bacterium]|nr:hypothetical protein [Candidatus Daviesbacteria bacterium]